HLEKEFGVHYAMGGVQEIARQMVGIIEDQGGLMRMNSTVDEIMIKDGAAAGVRLETGEIMGADIVVSNADAGFTYRHLLRNHNKKRWTDRKLDKTRLSMGLFVWYFGTKGTKGKWTDVGHHTIVNGPRYQDLLNDIFMKEHLADDFSLYVHRPSVTDPSVAPDGDDTFYVLSPVPHIGGDTPVDWKAEVEVYRQKVAKVVNDMMPGFEDHISAQMTFTPEDFESRYLSPAGAGFSIEPRILQSAWFRPHNISEEAKGLYLVGAGTHPGAGVPGVVSAAEVLGKLIPDVTRVAAE
ncbi:MAG: phytoene desaturase family protein, partial [Pseudomonadota bacterium]